MMRVLGAATAVFVLDMITKMLALANLAPFSPFPVIPGFFNLTLVFNRGAAFGILPGAALVFAALAGITVLAIFLVAWRHRHLEPVAMAAMGMIAGGASGNLVDRLRWGHVVDFLDFYLGAAHWPAFNIADSALCTGAGLLLLLSLRPAAKTR